MKIRFLEFVKAYARVQFARWRGYRVIAPADVVGKRWLHCEHCPFFDGALCEVCGCMVEGKVVIAVEKCPKGYWKAVWRKKEH